MRVLLLAFLSLLSVLTAAEPSPFRAMLNRQLDLVIAESLQEGKSPATKALEELDRWDRSSLTAAEQDDYDFVRLRLLAEQALEAHPKLAIPRDLPTPLWDAVRYDLLNAFPLMTTAGIQAWLDRLAQVPTSLEEAVKTLAALQGRGTPLPRFLLSQIGSSIDPYLWTPPAHWEFVRSFVERVHQAPGLSPEIRRRFESSAVGLAERLVGPAYKKLKKSLETLAESAPVGYSLCVPVGPDAYQAIIWDTLGENVPAATLHRWALADIARLDAEMAALVPGGSEPTYARALEELRTETHFSEDNRDWALQIQRDSAAWLAPLFPEALPEFELRTGTSDAIPNYFPPMADPPQAAHLNLPRGTLTQPADAKSLLWHEGLPGHALQLGLHAQRSDLAGFRRFAWPDSAVEGWARYAEVLMLESPLADRFSVLQEKVSQYNDAVVVALDTGLNALNWTYKDALAFLRKTEKAFSQTFDARINRSLYWPGQSLSYYFGQKQFLALRDDQRAAKGASFDHKAFHQSLLAEGVLPFEMLRSKFSRSP